MRWFIWLSAIVVVFRRLLTVPDQVTNKPVVINRTSLFESMDFDVTNLSSNTISSRISLSSGPATTTQQTKRQVTSCSEANEDDDADKRSSKRLRKNSTTSSNRSSSTSLSVPAERSPINASYVSMQRYRTRVINRNQLLLPCFYDIHLCN